jgi:hypothetical protein
MHKVSIAFWCFEYRCEEDRKRKGKFGRVYISAYTSRNTLHHTVESSSEIERRRRRITSGIVIFQHQGIMDCFGEREKIIIQIYDYSFGIPF